MTIFLGTFSDHFRIFISPGSLSSDQYWRGDTQEIHSFFQGFRVYPGEAQSSDFGHFDGFWHFWSCPFRHKHLDQDTNLFKTNQFNVSRSEPIFEKQQKQLLKSCSILQMCCCSTKVGKTREIVKINKKTFGYSIESISPYFPFY